MKKYLVIGNPIKHSLSPEIHNYWFKKNNIKAIYEKRELDSDELKNLILEMREQKIYGINVTVPFKKKIIPHLDKLTFEAEKTQSVNTIYFLDNQILGHNTDILGFEDSIKNAHFNLSDKKIFILGAGGVVPSIIFALNKMKVSKIVISNRTREKAEQLKDLFQNLSVIDWGEIPEFDMIINATSLGLKNSDHINLDFSNVGDKKIFYDVIYNPSETKFLREGKSLGNKTENGKMMFVFQALAAFKIWHNIEPKIDNELIKLLEK